MTASQPLKQIRLQFQDETPSLSDDEKTKISDLSTVAFTNNGQYLWIGSDEWVTVERLERIDEFLYSNHKPFEFKDLINGFNPDLEEVDIEGIDCDSNYLWFVGSHSSKRKAIKIEEEKGETWESKVKLSDKELTKVSRDPNRYLLARIPLVDGELKKESESLKSAILKKNSMDAESDQLMEALAEDEYLRDILKSDLPSKDNGFDIEGMSVQGNKILIGLRGPVLRGIAILLEIEVQEESEDILTLKPIGDQGKLYKRHFLNLEGLGIRELCRDDSDLLILAGPAMTLDASYHLFRLKNAFTLEDKSLSTQDNKQLEKLIEIPHGSGVDRAEGIALLPSTDQSKSILVVYDAPSSKRIPDETTILADVFQLP